VKDRPHVVVLHTAFLGDIILAGPIAQALRGRFPNASISFVGIPAAVSILQNHPAIDMIIEYDKKGRMRGVGGLRSIIRTIRKSRFDIAVVPHRSLRSALIPFLAGIPVRIGFDTSAGRMLFTTVVPYRKDEHEVQRNLDLAVAVGASDSVEKPRLYPSGNDVDAVDAFLNNGNVGQHRFVTVAPGSVWFTKRWPEGSFVQLVSDIAATDLPVVLVGGSDDAELCSRIVTTVNRRQVMSAAGLLSPLQSAELIRRSIVLVSNDSAPMHMAVSVDTPVIALFGATVPEFGFAPLGEGNTILGTEGLACRPCSIHGGQRCPIVSFDCMKLITPEQVLDTVRRYLGSGRDLVKQ